MPNFDVRRHRRADAAHARDNLVVRGAGFWEHVKGLTVPDQHFVADIPLDAQVVVRDGRADRGDLTDHVVLVGVVDGDHVAFDTERVGHRHRCRQANLKFRLPRQITAFARRAKILVGHARLARITQFAEFDVLRFDTVRQAKQRKSRNAVRRAPGIRNKERTCAQQWILPADPQPPAADLAVGDALEPPAETATDRAEYFLDAAQADAADQMDALRSKVAYG